MACYMKLHLVALRRGPCLMGSHRVTCQPHVLYRQGNLMSPYLLTYSGYLQWPVHYISLETRSIKVTVRSKIFAMIKTRHLFIVFNIRLIWTRHINTDLFISDLIYLLDTYCLAIAITVIVGRSLKWVSLSPSRLPRASTLRSPLHTICIVN